MPLINRYDINGRYYKWGQHGHKYYYITGDFVSRQDAKTKALAQMRAIRASQARESKKKSNHRSRERYHSGGYFLPDLD